jgi:hypothetical protein
MDFKSAKVRIVFPQAPNVFMVVKYLRLRKVLRHKRCDGVGVEVLAFCLPHNVKLHCHSNTLIATRASHDLLLS